MRKLLIIAVLVVTSHYFYTGKLPFMGHSVTVKELRDRVASEPVPAEQVKVAINNSMITVCEVNGVDVRNMHGTTEQCINTYKSISTPYCFDQIQDFESKTYTSLSELDTDMTKIMKCSHDFLWVEVDT